MNARIENKLRVAEPLDKVWLLLKDPRQVVGCVPGAQITETIDDHTFKGSIKVKVGPIVTEYKGDVAISRLDEEKHEMELTGKGQDVRGKGSATMVMTSNLTSLPDGGTEVSAVAQISVAGMLAQFGGRVINDVSDILFKEFANRFGQLLSGGESAQTSAEPVSATKLMGSVIGAKFRKMVGSSEE